MEVQLVCHAVLLRALPGRSVEGRHRHEVRYVPQLALELRAERVLRTLADATEPERAKGPAVLARLTDDALRLGDANRAHASALSSAGASDPSGACSAGAGSAVWTGGRYGSTSTMLFPRDRATSSGRRRLFSPLTVAFAMLIGFVVPRLLASTSRIPASS